MSIPSELVFENKIICHVQLTIFMKQKNTKYDIAKYSYLVVDTNTTKHI